MTFFKKLCLGFQCSLASLLWLAYGILIKFYYYPITNYMAVKQLENSNNAYVSWRVYQFLLHNSIPILSLLTVLIFLPNIISLFTEKKERI